MNYRIAAVAAAATVVTLSACGSNSSQTSSGSPTGASASVAIVAGSHNSADVSFASDMIPHHSQALAMADMAISTASNPQVKALAVKIKAAQEPEIVTMTSWLKAWNQPVPSGSMSGMSGMGGTGMGMMSDADMAALGKATGKAFDTMWVTMMIAHHEGAVSMSKTELASGQYAQAKTLAQSIISSQTAQIQQLKALEKQLA
jgi:uncharacterized protein (DUF305 family)